MACCTAPAFPVESWHERAATVHAHGTEMLADITLQRWFTVGFRERHPDVVDDAAHIVNVQQPERVSALIRDHLRTGGHA